MMALFRALSWSYATRHPMQVALTVLGVSVGVATFTSVRSAQQTLVDGLRTTVDRVAGKAHLQVTGVGGVPEALLETLGVLEGVEGVAPVIEQVVTVNRGSRSAVLVLGVDLLADRRMRDYGFSGEDADLDDPLEFLAQPDSVAVSEVWATRVGVRLGDTVDVESGATKRRLTVRALLKPTGFAQAFGGNVAVTDVYAAQDLFGRYRHFDRIDIRLAEGVTIDNGAATVRTAVPGYEVDTPVRRSASLSNLISAFVASFDVSSGLAVLVGVFLIANVLRVSVERRRRPIGVARALGATPRQVQRLLLVEAAIVGFAGGVVGLALGRALTYEFLELMGQAVRVTYGVGDAAPATFGWMSTLGSVGVGIGASLFGAWGPARLAARVRPVEALASGVFRARSHVLSRRTFLIGLGLLAVPAVVAMVGTTAPIDSRSLLTVAVVTGAIAALWLTGPLSSELLTLASPVVSLLAPVAGPLATDSLRGQPRRTAASAAAVAISLALVLGTGGYLHSFRTAFDHWIDEIITADLIVRASAELAPSSQHLPGSVQGRLLNIPGVQSVDSYRADWVTVNGEVVMLASFDGAGFFARTHNTVFEGTRDDLVDGLVERGECAVSDNFARRYGFHRGDVIELKTPGGPARLRIAAVLASYLSDRGLIMVDRKVFLNLWRDEAVGAFHVTVRPGTDPGVVQQAIVEGLGADPPVLVSTREEFRAQALGAIDGFYTLTRVTVGLMLAVTLIGIATSLLSAVVDRRSELGLLKALGATRRQIRRSVVVEALMVAGCGLLVAVPLGALLARFLETTVADSYAGFVIPGTYPLALLGWLLVGVPVLAAAAAVLPAQQAVRLAASETMRHD